MIYFSEINQSNNNNSTFGDSIDSECAPSDAILKSNESAGNSDNNSPPKDKRAHRKYRSGRAFNPEKYTKDYKRSMILSDTMKQAIIGLLLGDVYATTPL